MLSRFATIGILAFCSIAALASGGSSSDPILGAYSGTWSYDRRTLIGGEFDPAESGSQQVQVGLEFAAGHGGSLTGFAGKWKKSAHRYRMNCSKAATETFRFEMGDPTATVAMKAKSMRRVGADELRGRIAMTSKFHQNGARVKSTAKGPFTALIGADPA